jgi:predicted DCC family thiol-disulfide oxidoreductase YuxK
VTDDGSEKSAEPALPEPAPQKEPQKEPQKGPQKEPFLERMRRLRLWLREHYCRIDPRTLGVFRLVLGFLLTADCIRHWKEARWFYSNEGVLTNHYHLFRPSSGFNFSIYHAFSSLGEVHLAFALSTFVYFCFFIGWHTRLFSVLSFVLVTSMDNRIVMIENGGYVVVNLLAAWAMFMPTDRRFSVDALVRSFRERKEATADDLNDRYRPPRETELFVSGIVFLAVANLAVVYFFNVVNKSGRVWRVGETVHYVLHLDRMITGLAAILREHMPLWLSRVFTWGVLALEGILVTLILAPAARRYTRPLAMMGVAVLHTSFGVLMRLGPFSWFMIGWSFLLPTPENWADLEAWYRRRASPRVVVYDRTSPLAFTIARLLSRLDGLDLLRFEESPDASEAAESPAPSPLIAARDPETGKVVTGSAVIRDIAQALPGGRYFWPILNVLTLGLSGPLFRLFERRREAAARFFGLSIPARTILIADEPSPLRERLTRGRMFVRETLIAYLAICAVWQALQENKNVPPVRDTWALACKGWKKVTKREDLVCEKEKTPEWLTKLVEQPKFMQATIQYPRIFQGWGMFAPNPITDDGSLTVDAITADGRRIDPFTGKEPDLDLTDARGLGLNQIWQDYFNRIRLDRNKVFRQGLKEYLNRWHIETGRPEDELVAFDVYWVRDQCPRRSRS